jgi:recombination protein RecT
MNQQGRKFEGRKDVAVRQKTDPVSTVRDLIKKLQPQIKNALPRHMDADRTARMAMTTFQKNPDLQKCDPISFVGAIIEASQLGLEIDNNLGQAYLIPFWNEKLKKLMVQLIPGYKGLITLAKRTENVADIATGVVHENDVFDFQRGTDEFLKHIPCLKGDPGAPYAAWGVIKFKDGTHHFEVMSIDQVNKIRDDHGKSKAWKTDYEEMVRKTLVRRTTKYVELSPEYNRAVILENNYDSGAGQNLVLDNMSDAIDVTITDYQEQESEEELAKQLLEAGGFSLLKQPDGFQKFINMSADNLDTDAMGVLRRATSDQVETEEFWRAFQNWEESASRKKEPQVTTPANQIPKASSGEQDQKQEKDNAPADTKANSGDQEISTKDQWKLVESLCKELDLKKLDLVKEFTGQHNTSQTTKDQADKIIEHLQNLMQEKSQQAPPDTEWLSGDGKSAKDRFFMICNETSAHPKTLTDALFPDVKSLTDKHWKIALAACYLGQQIFEFAIAQSKDGAYRLAAAAHTWGVKDQSTGDKFMRQAQDRDWLKKRLEEVK